MKVYYFNVEPNHFGIKTCFDKKFFGHKIYKEPQLLFLTPSQTDKKNLCPKNMLKLKQKYNFNKIVMFDRVVGTDKNILILDHVNRSGISFVFGKTPYKNFPMFPDMSGIYITKKNEKGHEVQTLGIDRFQSPPMEKGVVFSESAAIIAPLWHYVGVGVRCFGVCTQKADKGTLKPL